MTYRARCEGRAGARARKARREERRYAKSILHAMAVWRCILAQIPDALASVRRQLEEMAPGLRLTDAERADWAYGNAKASNPDVTREMAERAVKR